MPSHQSRLLYHLTCPCYIKFLNQFCSTNKHTIIGTYCIMSERKIFQLYILDLTKYGGKSGELSMDIFEM